MRFAQLKVQTLLLSLLAMVTFTFSSCLDQSAKQDQMADDIKSIKEAIYNPETGLYARLRDVEQWQDNMSRVIWTFGLGFIGLISKAVMELL